MLMLAVDSKELRKRLGGGHEHGGSWSTWHVLMGFALQGQTKATLMEIATRRGASCNSTLVCLGKLHRLGLVKLLDMSDAILRVSPVRAWNRNVHGFTLTFSVHGSVDGETAQVPEETARWLRATRGPGRPRREEAVNG